MGNNFICSGDWASVQLQSVQHCFLVPWPWQPWASRILELRLENRILLFQLDHLMRHLMETAKLKEEQMDFSWLCDFEDFLSDCISYEYYPSKLLHRNTSIFFFVAVAEWIQLVVFQHLQNQPLCSSLGIPATASACPIHRDLGPSPLCPFSELRHLTLAEQCSPTKRSEFLVPVTSLY